MQCGLYLLTVQMQLLLLVHPPAEEFREFVVGLLQHLFPDARDLLVQPNLVEACLRLFLGMSADNGFSAQERGEVSS